MKLADRTYIDGFESWSDVQKEFDVNVPEPDEVILAEYDLSQEYKGSARVLYRNGENYYLVEGSHCSCFGLEGQWDPTEYSGLDELLQLLKKRWDQDDWAPLIEGLSA